MRPSPGLKRGGTASVWQHRYPLNDAGSPSCAQPTMDAVLGKAGGRSRHNQAAGMGSGFAGLGEARKKFPAPPSSMGDGGCGNSTCSDAPRRRAVEGHPADGDTATQGGFSAAAQHLKPSGDASAAGIPLDRVRRLRELKSGSPHVIWNHAPASTTVTFWPSFGVAMRSVEVAKGRRRAAQTWLRGVRRMLYGRGAALTGEKLSF